MGYYISLNEKIPENNSVVITNLNFNPQNATAFNVTVLNPSFSPDEKVQVKQIGLSENTSSAEGTISFVQVASPTLPSYISRGSSQTFTCVKDWTPYVNKTMIISVFVADGSGSTSTIKIPYTKLFLKDYDFHPNVGVSNFTLTFQNDPLSATYLNITEVSLPFTPPINFTTLMEPRLPFTLLPNETSTFTCRYNWINESRAGGSFSLVVETLQGYREAYPITIPKLAFTVEGISFNATDTAHFNVTVRNEGPTGTYLNVSGIEARIGNNIFQTAYVPLNSSVKTVFASSSVVFRCDWNWTNYRNTLVSITVRMTQGIDNSGPQQTPPAALLSIQEDPVFPDTQHFIIKVKNSASPRSIKTANVTKITVTTGGTELQVPIEQPSSGPYLIGVNETTMFSCLWNWTSFLNQNITISVYTNETSTANIFRNATTPANASSYHVYLSVPSAPTFNTADTTQFTVDVRNSQFSNRNATITTIAVLLINNTTTNSTCAVLPFTLLIDSTVTFTCQWDWTGYRNKNVVILVYTDEGLKAIFVTKTPS